jgi:hypothetical protein
VKARGGREIKGSDEFGLEEIHLADSLVPLKGNWRLDGDWCDMALPGGTVVMRGDCSRWIVGGADGYGEGDSPSKSMGRAW